MDIVPLFYDKQRNKTLFYRIENQGHVNLVPLGSGEAVSKLTWTAGQDGPTPGWLLDQTLALEFFSLPDPDTLCPDLWTKLMYWGLAHNLLLGHLSGFRVGQGCV